MRGSVYEYRTAEINRNTTPCKAVDNIYNYEYEKARNKYVSVETLFDNEKEFNEAKERYNKQIA